MFDQGLAKEITKMKEVFNQMETEVAACFVERKCFTIKKKEFLLKNERLLEHILYQDVLCIAMDDDVEINCVVPENDDNFAYADMEQNYIDEYSKVRHYCSGGDPSQKAHVSIYIEVLSCRYPLPEGCDPLPLVELFILVEFNKGRLVILEFHESAWFGVSLVDFLSSSNLTFSLLFVFALATDFSFLDRELGHVAFTKTNNSWISVRLLSATITLSNKAEDPISELSTSELSDKLNDKVNMIYHYSLECIVTLKKKLETLQQEKERIDGKLAGSLTASKDLDNLIESQRSDKNKEGLGYSAVPPPIAQIYSSPKKDLSWIGLSKFVDDTVTDYSRPSPTIESSPDDAQNKNPFTETGASDSTILSKPVIKFVKAADKATKGPTTDKVKTAKKPAVNSPDDAQNKNPSTETEASDSTILSKPVIKFVKAADKATKGPTTDKGEPKDLEQFEVLTARGKIKRCSEKKKKQRSGEDCWDHRAFISRNLIADATSSLGEDCWELNVQGIPTASEEFAHC
nr:hypothetical protein [Tanacetum cinerariifolium]